MKIKITNMHEVFKIAEEESPEKIISIVDINSPIKSRNENHLVVTFTDIVEIPQRFLYPHINPKIIPILPAPEHILQVLEFTKDSKNEYILIHCAAGKSRSPAMAIAICMQHGMSCNEALAYILSIRPQAIPNQLMIKHIDDIFKLNGEFLKSYTDWYLERIKQIAIMTI